MDNRVAQSPANRWIIARRIVGLPLSRRGTFLRVIICVASAVTLAASLVVLRSGNGSFVALGPMAYAHEGGQTATLLSDGRVLILGGNPAGSAEIYDPKTGVFVDAGSTATASSGHSATLVSDGRVLVESFYGMDMEATGWEWCHVSASGVRSDCTPEVVAVGSAKIEASTFDLASGQYGPSSVMNTARSHYTTTPLADGRVLMVGGLDENEHMHEGEHALDSAEVFDPTTGKFTQTGRMTTVRAYHTATLLADGRVLITGGRTGKPGCCGYPLDSAELYDPRTGVFTPTGSMLDSKADQTATLLADGRVLVAGGLWIGDEAETYDPKTGKFTRTGPMNTDRRGHNATLLADGRVLVVGGWNSEATSNDTAKSAELFQPDCRALPGPLGSLRLPFCVP